MEPDVVDRMINIISMVLSAITSLFAGYIAFVTLRLTATPRVRIDFLNAKGGNNRPSFKAQSQKMLKFSITNAGHWYAKPPALRIHMFISFEPGCSPTAVRYGSVQEIRNTDVKIGIGRRPYLEASGISVFYGEPGEEFLIEATMPRKSGTYRCWIAASCGDRIGLGLHQFEFEVVGG